MRNFNFSQRGNDAITSVAATVFKTTRRKADNSLEGARKIAGIIADKTKRAAWDSAERVASYSATKAMQVGKTASEVAVAFGESVSRVATVKAQTAKILVLTGAETAKNAVVQSGLQASFQLQSCIKSYVSATRYIILEKSAPLISQAQMLFMKNLEKVAQVAPGLARSISQINQVNGQSKRGVKPNTAAAAELKRENLSVEKIYKRLGEKDNKDCKTQ